MKFKDLKIGQHLWGIYDNQLVMLAKFDDGGYEVCGAWECGIGKDKVKIIKLVEVPEGYEDVPFYYR